MLIRLATTPDLPSIRRTVNHTIEHGAQHFGTSPLDPSAVEGFAMNPYHPCFVAEDAGQIRGVAWSSPHKTREAYAWTVDVAVYVAPGSEGRGVGSATQGRVVECIRDQGYVTALAVIALPNPASVRLHERLGFRAVGTLPRMGFKLDAWRDIGIWHLALRDPGDSPPKPVLRVKATVGRHSIHHNNS